MNAPAKNLEQIDPSKPALNPKAAAGLLERLSKNVSEALWGKEERAKLALTAAVARGHLLIEDVPGVGKTTLAEAVAKSFQLDFAKIQFTSDLMPADIVGAQVFLPNRSDFEFRPGPIFHSFVLADELNRAPPRTQSALLEAMASDRVTVDGQSHPLPTPFLVVATQNPEDAAGTFALPDSQLDRFLFRISLGHLPPEVEAKLLVSDGAAERRQAAPISSPMELLGLQRAARRVRMEDSIGDYLVRLGEATRAHPMILRGASTRAMLSVASACRAHALWDARDFVLPNDLRTVFVPGMSHRVLLRDENAAGLDRDAAEGILTEVLSSVPVPR